MLKKLGLVDLLASIKSQVEAHTGTQCYTEDPGDTSAPYYLTELNEKIPSGNENMFIETFSIWIQCIAGENGTAMDIYDLIEGLENALEEDIQLPGSCEIFRQESEGVQVLQLEETGKKRAVASYNFIVRYGYKSKI